MTEDPDWIKNPNLMTYEQFSDGSSCPISFITLRDLAALASAKTFTEMYHYAPQTTGKN